MKWSRRVWQDSAVIQKVVERTASNVSLRGRHPNEYVTVYEKHTVTNTYNASRLLVTESARVQAESQKLTYLKDLGEDGEYKYVAKIDKKTSKICLTLNGKVFKVKDMIPGVNAPPMHPWCRSTTVPHVGNWRDKFFTERKDKYRIQDNVIEKEKLQEKAKKEMLDMIRSGKIKVEINPEKQNRHNKEHELFKQSVEMAKINGEKLPSYTIISNEELNKLVKLRATTGEFLLLNGKFNRKEIIDFKLPIGKSYIDNKYIEKVHYSKTGTHVIPYIKK